MSVHVQDYGYPQSTATETLKSYIYNEPETVERTLTPRKKSVSGSSVGSAYSSVVCGCSSMGSNLSLNPILHTRGYYCATVENRFWSDWPGFALLCSM